MTVILNNYHRKVNAVKQKSVAYWKTLLISHEGIFRNPLGPS